MPIVSIEVLKKYSKEQEISLIHIVHSALQKAFKIMNNDINARLFVHEPHRFPIPKTNPILYAQPELYTLIIIDCYAGRSLDAKRNLYRFIVENLEPFGIPKDHVKILIRERLAKKISVFVVDKRGVMLM